MKDTDFYNAESVQYSTKRYPAVGQSFTQYFFKKRLAVTLDLLQRYTPKEKQALLEVGCADGVVAEAIYNRFPQQFDPIDAIDISPEMIAVAQKNSKAPIRFTVRGLELPGRYGVVVEVGVLNYSNFTQDMQQVASALTEGGVYIASVAGFSSLQNRVKGSEGYGHLLSYGEYEKTMSEYFTVVETVPVGFFVPLLWRLPALARVLQPAVEWLLQPLENLALEKVYVLTKK